MKTVTNQKVIMIKKRKEHPENFGITDKEAMYIAASKLTYSAYKIWHYLSCQSDNSEKSKEELWALSRQHIMDKMAISKNSYTRAIKELEDNGYIKKIQGNMYEFNEYIESDITKMGNEDSNPQNGDNCGPNLVTVVPPKMGQSCTQNGGRNNTINNTNNNTNNNTIESISPQSEIEIDPNNECKVQNEPTIEKKKEIINLFKQKNNYETMKNITGLNFNQINKIITDYKNNPKEYFYESPKENKLTFSNNSYIDTKFIRDIIEEYGNNIESINKELKYYYDKSISDGIDKDKVIEFFKIFNYTKENGYQIEEDKGEELTYEELLSIEDIKIY